MELDSKFSKRIRIILKERGVTMRELSRITGITQSYLSQLLTEDSRKKWNLEKVQLVADALNTPVWQLFMQDTNVPEQKHPLIDTLDRLEEEALDELTPMLNPIIDNVTK